MNIQIIYDQNILTVSSYRNISLKTLKNIIHSLKYLIS